MTQSTKDDGMGNYDRLCYRKDVGIAHTDNLFDLNKDIQHQSMIRFTKDERIQGIISGAVKDITSIIADLESTVASYRTYATTLENKIDAMESSEHAGDLKLKERIVELEALINQQDAELDDMQKRMEDW